MRQLEQTNKEIINGAGAVFKFVNPEYCVTYPHFKILIGRDKSKNELYLLTCTSQQSILTRGYVSLDNVIAIEKANMMALQRI